jgi:hypothetical protein
MGWSNDQPRAGSLRVGCMRSFGDDRTCPSLTRLPLWGRHRVVRTSLRSPMREDLL